MRLYPIKTPEFVQHMYPDFLWRVSSNKKEIYLTFDDGPTPKVTEFVLDVLNDYQAKATFFCIGKNVEEHPQICTQIVDQGHSIGNHTHNHLKGWRSLRKEYLENVLKAQKTIQKLSPKDQNTQLFRPPYGKIKKMQTKDLQKNNFKIVMWDILSGDWDARISGERCLRNVKDNITNGSIVVFHDSKKAEKNLKFALPKVLAHFSEKGFQFKAIV